MAEQTPHTDAQDHEAIAAERGTSAKFSSIVKNGESVTEDGELLLQSELRDDKTRARPAQLASSREESTVQRLTRSYVIGSDPSRNLPGFSTTNMPGVRFSRWAQFKNRLKSDEAAGIVVEALVGPPVPKGELLADEYVRKVSVMDAVPTEQTSRLAPLQLQPMQVANMMLHRVRITSKAVLTRLASLLNPDQDWLTTPVTFVRPFRELIFVHEAMKQQLREANETAAETIAFQDDREELSNYIDFIEKVVLPLKTLWSPGQLNSPLKIRCIDLWYIYQPGELMYWENADFGRYSQGRHATGTFDKSSVSHSSRIGILLSCEIKSRNFFDEDSAWLHMLMFWSRWYSLKLLQLDFDGRAFRPVVVDVEVDVFEGEKDVRSLPVWPLRFEPDAERIKAEYQEYGRKFTTFCSRERHWLHSGWTLESGTPGRGGGVSPPEFIESEVIVDFQEALRSLDAWSPQFLDHVSMHQTVSVRSTTDGWHICGWHDNGLRSAALTTTECVVYDGQLQDQDMVQMARAMPMVARGKIQPEDLDEAHYFLLPRRVFVYSLQIREFIVAHVDSLGPVRFSDGGFKNLRIEGTHLRMIKSMVQHHFDSRKLEVDHKIELAGQDFVQGKGRGVVMLLHGVPGVGKTATAEAVAQEYARPLFPMTCGDLGTTPEVVSRNLMNIFRLANLWDCVLLLDEADVFLSRREQRNNDLLRNALVSVFLRVLEYYSGILFLTTNRTGVLDEAVKSRVHASFYYPDLNWSQTRDIFQLNMDRLRRIEDQRTQCGEEGLVILNNQIMKFAEDHWNEHHNSPFRWNGRQIRNAFQIAAGLAHSDGREAAVAAEKEGIMRRDSGLEGSNPGVQRQLTKQHFQDVADAIFKYDHYRLTTHRKSDNEMAKDRNERPEDFTDDVSEGSAGRQRGFGAATAPRMRGDYGGGPGQYDRQVRYDGGGVPRNLWG